MKLQSKPVLAGVIPDKTTRRRSGAGEPSKPGSLNIPVGNLQALASELHQSATQGLFEYPRNWVLTARVVAFMFISLALLRLMLVVLPLIQAVVQQTPVSRVSVSAWEVVGVSVGVVLSVALAELLLNLFPALKVTPQGLGISTLFGWRRVPWAQVGVLRVMEAKKERYVVMLPFKSPGRPSLAPMLRIIPALTGASTRRERGVVFTSDIERFDRLVQLIVSYMAQVSGQTMPRLELFLDETAVMPLAQLLLAPEDAVVRMARESSARDDIYGLPDENRETALNWRSVLTKQTLIATPPALMLLTLEATRHGTVTLIQLGWAIVLLALGVVELPFYAKLSQTVGEMVVGSGQFKRSALAYLLLQVPRAFLVLIGTALVSIGMPIMIGQILWLAGIGLITWFALRFVQRVYYVPITQTLWAGVGTFVFQVAVIALFFGVS